jgi:signal peptidase I
MPTSTTIGNRDKDKARLAAIVLPGLGQIYNGEPLKGICFFSIFILLPITLLRATMMFPDSLLMVGVLISFISMCSMYVIAIFDASRSASLKGKGYLLKAYNRWYVYLLLWFGAAFWIAGSLAASTQKNIMMFCRIVSGSMEPSLQKGDFVIFDNTSAGKVAPHKGDVILFRYPDDRSKLYVKRLAGLPGDTLPLDNSSVIIVPHGHVFVLGDNREHAKDSRTYGPVPLCDVLGKARVVYFSVGPQGIRWSRIGKTL